MRACGWFKHKWTKWQTVETGQLQQTVNSLGLPIHEEFGEKKPVLGRYETQRRICEQCGKAQLREIRA